MVYFKEWVLYMLEQDPSRNKDDIYQGIIHCDIKEPYLLYWGVDELGFNPYGLLFSEYVGLPSNFCFKGGDWQSHKDDVDYDAPFDNGEFHVSEGSICDIQINDYEQWYRFDSNKGRYKRGVAKDLPKLVRCNADGSY